MTDRPFLRALRARIAAALEPFRLHAPLTDRGWGQLRRLLSLAKPYRAATVGAIFALLVSSLLTLAAPVTLSFLVDSIVPGGDPSDLSQITILLIGIFVIQGVAIVIRSYLLDYVSLRVIADLRIRLFTHIQGLSLRFFNERRTGELVSRVISDVATIRSVVTEDLANSFSYTLTFLGAATLIVITNWRMTLLMILLVPTVSMLSSYFGKRIRSLSARVQDDMAGVTTILEEAIGGVRVVQSFVREPFEGERFRNGVERTFKTALQRARVQATSLPLISALFSSVIIFILWFGGTEVLAGRMTTGQLVTFVILTMNMSNSLRQMSRLWNDLQEAVGSSERLFQLLDIKPDIYDKPGVQPLPRLAGRLMFEDVSFSYRPAELEPDAPLILDRISLDIQPGEVLALVGPSGAGKSTLLNLILRFYDPTQGRILADDRDIRNSTLQSLREQIALVQQETHLFGGTVRENILYGRLDAVEEEIVEAARAANAHDFIIKLPRGYDTIVGERGIKLSGGQRQRIAIARALLKDPRILLLDEATSALDNESERLVQEALERLMVGRTSIVIAHRLSTVQHAHRIAVLNAGRMVEIDTHEGLLARDGLYAKLYRLQFKNSRDMGPTGVGLPEV